jgi:pimeloyl-ACP methyl ester carboxylesterase
VIFVHGSISDYTYWQGQIPAFAARYHVIAYSRRYNFPNDNPARAHYSAVADAEDLAGLIKAQHLGPVFVVGHSYGALTALFLAQRHPELVRAAVLAEPPAVSLLSSLHDKPAAGQAMYADIQERLVAPMKTAFAAGDTEAGVATFIDYVFADPHAWHGFSLADKAETIRDAHEWDVVMTAGELFPEITPDQVRAIRTPMLLMSGGRSYPFLAMIDSELAYLLPHNRRIIYGDAGHQMWLKHPDECRKDAEAFFAENGGPAGE